MKAIEMRLSGVPVKEVMEQLSIRNNTQLKIWMKWYRKGRIKSLWSNLLANNTAMVKDLSMHRN